jgi:hypothetical protein
MKIATLVTLLTLSLNSYGACTEVNAIYRKFLLKEKLSASQRSSLRSTESVKGFMGKWQDQKVISDNRYFMANMEKPLPSGQKRMFFDVENSVLKGLNDNVLEDKGLGDAVNNLFNQKFIKNLKEHPELANRLSSQYSDFKSLRMSFDYASPEEAAKIQKALDDVYKKSNDEFLKEMDSAKMSGLWQGHEGQLGSPETWFLAGSGDNALEANMASRAQRRIASESGAAKVSSYSENVDELYSQMDGIRNLQTTLSNNKVLRDKEVLTKIGDEYVLSKEMITILRKNKRSDYSNSAKYVNDITKKSKDLFGVNLSKAEIDTMTKYFEDIDAMSPPLFIRERQLIPLENANNGLVSVDFAGIGVDNAQGAMVGLTKSSMESSKKMGTVSDTLQNVWKEVDGVTDEMHMAQRSYNSAVKEIEPGHSGALFSGDDGMFFPSKNWNSDDKVKLVSELSKKDASKYRVTFVPTKYADGKVISASNRSEYVVKAEKVEKALRAKVTGVGKDRIDFKRAKDMIFAIDFTPAADGNGVFNLIVKGNDLSPKEIKSLRKSFAESLEEGSTVGRIIH